MAHIAVDLEITRLNTGFFQRRYHGWRNLRRKQRVAATQDVQHLGLDLCEIGPRVETEQRAPQDDQRSEERRVGKECELKCRSWGSPYRSKKKHVGKECEHKCRYRVSPTNKEKNM